MGVSGFPGVPGRTLTGSDEVIGAAGAARDRRGAAAGAGAGAGAGAEGTGKPAGAAPPNKAGAADIACIACIIAGFDMRAASAAGFAIVAAWPRGERRGVRHGCQQRLLLRMLRLQSGQRHDGVDRLRRERRSRRRGRRGRSRGRVRGRIGMGGSRGGSTSFLAALGTATAGHRASAVP